jgi:DNA-directed RNA polymerase specialized sigma subunit
MAAFHQPRRSEDTPLQCFPGSDAQRLLRIDEEAPLKDQKIALLEQRVSNLEKENDLLKQQNAIQEKLTELPKREGEVYKTAFEKEKELTDRALKLAEIAKPKSNWELQGLLGMAIFILGVLAGK